MRRGSDEHRHQAGGLRHSLATVFGGAVGAGKVAAPAVATAGDGRTRPGPDVSFEAEVPSSGTYRLYLDFRHKGVVRTAELTVVAGAPAPTGPEPYADHADHADHAGHTHGH